MLITMLTSAAGPPMSLNARSGEELNLSTKKARELIEAGFAIRSGPPAVRATNTQKDDEG